MNYLSNKLAKALLSPSFANNRKTSSLTPSSASTIVKDSKGNSRVVGACLRQQYYRIKDFVPDEGDKNIDWTLSALMGEKMHDLLVDLIDVFGFEMGLQKLTREHSIYDTVIKLSGRCDLIVWDHNNKEPVGIEIKSIGEYKAKKAVEQPIDEHVLQSVVYLDFYNRNIPEGQKKITKWYIWYVSRTENWTIKSKSHNSDFTMLWDYCIELDNGVPIITLTDGSKQRWTDYSIENIYKRYNDLHTYLGTNSLPPRDYEILYSEEKITGMYQNGLISKKGDSEVIDKWLKKGAPPGKLKITMGDSECSFCEYQKLCWEGTTSTSRKKFSNLPSAEPKKEVEKKNSFFL
jgi:hypothetical protein